MNMYTFAESLTITEVNELSNILFDIKKKWAMEAAKPLVSEEMALCIQGKYVDAIKAYRARLGSTLMEAKIAVDVFRRIK